MKKLFLSLLATTLIFSGCSKEEKPKEKEKEKEVVVEECDEIDIEFEYQEGKEEDYLEDTYNHYKEIQDNNGIYYITSYGPVRNSTLDLYYIYNSFYTMEDCSQVGVIEGESSGTSYNSKDSYEGGIVYKFLNDEESIYEYEFDNKDNIVISDVYDDEDQFEKMYDAVGIEILDKYFEDMVEEALDYDDIEYDEENDIVSYYAYIDTKEYGEIPFYIDLNVDQGTFVIYMYTYVNNDILSEDEKNEATEFYVTFGKNSTFKLYEDINDEILDFEEE